MSVVYSQYGKCSTSQIQMIAGGSGVFSVSRSVCVYHCYPVVFGQGPWRRACHDVLNVWNMLMMVVSPFKGILSICYLSFPLFWCFSANFLCVYILVELAIQRAELTVGR